MSSYLDFFIIIMLNWSSHTLGWHCILFSKNDAETVYLCIGFVDATQAVHIHPLCAGIVNGAGTVYLQYIVASNDAETV